MKLQFEYGNEMMDVTLPDENTDVFIPGETVPDPPVLENIYEETKRSILNPIGVEPISKQVKKAVK